MDTYQMTISSTEIWVWLISSTISVEISADGMTNSDTFRGPTRTSALLLSLGLLSLVHCSVNRGPASAQWWGQVRHCARLCVRSRPWHQQKYAKVWEARKNRRRWGGERKKSGEQRMRISRGTVGVVYSFARPVWRDAMREDDRTSPAAGRPLSQQRLLRAESTACFCLQALMAPCSKPRIAKHTRSSRWRECDWTMMTKWVVLARLSPYLRPRHYLISFSFSSSFPPVPLSFFLLFLLGNPLRRGTRLPPRNTGVPINLINRSLGALFITRSASLSIFLSFSPPCYHIENNRFTDEGRWGEIFSPAYLASGT